MNFGFLTADSGFADSAEKLMRQKPRVMLEKQTIREQAAEKLRGITPEYAAAVAVSIARVLLTLPEMLSAHVVSLYWAIKGEIDLKEVCLELNRQGKETLLPRFDKAAGAYEMASVSNWLTETDKGHYGIREPLSSQAAATDEVLKDQKTLWCVPALAFDVSGNRLGRGGGYYDRLLKATSGPKVGIAYDRQIYAELSAASHDVPMDFIVTENRCLRCSRQAA